MKTEKTSQKTEVNFNEKQLVSFEKIISFNWAMIASDIKKTLNLMALSYIRSERIEGTDGDDRSVVAFHLQVLQGLIDNLRYCELYEPDIEKKKIYFDNHISGFNCLFDEPDFGNGVIDTLSGLSLDYIQSEQIEGEPLEYREAISNHLHLLNNLVADISDLAKITEEIRTTNSDSNQSLDTKPVDYQCNECLRKKGVIELLEEQLATSEKRYEDLLLGIEPESSDCLVVKM